MNKKLIIGLVAVTILALGGVGYAYSSNQSKKDADDKMAMVKKTETDIMVKPGETMTEDVESKKSDPEVAMQKAASYVTLTDYNKDPNIYKASKKVYFFHAPWCSICRGIDEDISSDTTQIPTGTTFIKTDFDNNTDLRQKYGVTVQYTFVQVDNDGNEIRQWSATNLDKAIAGIQ